MNLNSDFLSIIDKPKKKTKKTMTIQKRNKKPAKKAKTIVTKKQTKGTPVNSKKADAKHTALKPGLRISKGGNLYTETRKDRSDKDPKRKL